MKRFFSHLRPNARLAVLTAALTCAMAQQSRDPMRQAFQNWRQSDQELERDAAKRGPDFGSRADKLAAAAAKYTDAKKAYFESRGAQLAAQADSLPAFDAPISGEEDEKRISMYLGLEVSTVDTGIDAFGNDPDKGIQQLRQTMQREKAALSAVSSGTKDRQKAAMDAVAASQQAEQQRMDVADHIHKLAASLGQAGTSADAPAWADYYRSLRNGAPGESTPAITQNGAPQNGSAPNGSAPNGSARNAATSAANLPPSPNSSGNPAPSNPPPSNQGSPARSVAPLSLSRYVGAWTFVAPSSIYRGLQPDFVDLVVHEDSGELNGTLFGRFKTPAGTDPVIRFDFSGPIQTTRNQTFVLITSDGTRGAIELIPGPAFNLLEVNFGVDPHAGTIRQGNFILVKK